jgi:radical SAM superfamily enzyme YgiQ (UPF0313 family)
MFTVLRQHGVDVDVLDLENDVGNPGASDRDAFAPNAQRAVEKVLTESAEDPALCVVSCSSSLQYSASFAVAAILRRLRPAVPIAVTGFHVSARPDDFTYPGAVAFDWVILGEPEMALVGLATSGDGPTGGPVLVEGTPLEHTAANLPDCEDYPYVRSGLPVLEVYLSRGCPFPNVACQLRPGSPGWRAFPPDAVFEAIDRMTALKPARIDVLDPAFGLDPSWRMATLERLDRTEGRRPTPVRITVRPETLTRHDVDLAYKADLRLEFDLGTLSAQLLSRTAAVPQPIKHIDRALDLLSYINAKGLLTYVNLVFNEPGETRESAAETLDRLEEFVDQVPNTTLRLNASSWVYIPYADPATELDVPFERYGTRILHPEWWREGIPSERAAKAVIASSELQDLEAGDESYWRPRFEAVSEKLAAKLTGDAKRGIRSHEWVGTGATGVPHGFWAEPRWH